MKAKAESFSEEEYNMKEKESGSVTAGMTESLRKEYSDYDNSAWNSASTREPGTKWLRSAIEPWKSAKMKQVLKSGGQKGWNASEEDEKSNTCYIAGETEKSPFWDGKKSFPPQSLRTA